MDKIAGSLFPFLAILNPFALCLYMVDVMDDLIIKGLRSIRSDYLLAGTLPAAALALIVDCVLGLVEKWLTPEGLRLDK